MSSLCKLYFRELPNPLLTYQLYGKFSVSKGDSEVRGCWDALGPVPIMPVHNLRRPCQCLGRTNAWCVSMTSSNSCPRHTIGKPGGVGKGCGGLTRELRLRCPLPLPPQDPGVPAEALGPHGKTQCQYQHACPQPGHCLGTQPATVSWQLTSLSPMG